MNAIKVRKLLKFIDDSDAVNNKIRITEMRDRMLGETEHTNTEKKDFNEAVMFLKIKSSYIFCERLLHSRKF